MQRSIIINVLQDDKKLSVKLSYTIFEVSYNSCNSNSQQCCTDWCCCWYVLNNKDNRENLTCCWCNNYDVTSRWCQCEQIRK